MKKFRIEVKWGILFFLSGLAWMALEKKFGLARPLNRGACYLHSPLCPLGDFHLCSCTLGEKEKKPTVGE